MALHIEDEFGAVDRRARQFADLVRPTVDLIEPAARAARCVGSFIASSDEAAPQADTKKLRRRRRVASHWPVGC